MNSVIIREILNTPYIEVGIEEKNPTIKYINRYRVLDCVCIYCRRIWGDYGFPTRMRVCVWCRINIKFINDKRKSRLKSFKRQIKLQKRINTEIIEIGLQPNRIHQTLFYETIGYFMK